MVHMANRAFRASREPVNLIGDATANMAAGTAYNIQNLTTTYVRYASAASAPDPDSFRGAFMLAPGEFRKVTAPASGGYWFWGADGNATIAIDEAPTE